MATTRQEMQATGQLTPKGTTAPSGPKPPGKRERLIQGAAEVIYERGVERTSLAEIAEHTGVPVGNIYYYFKTKDDLVGAVVKVHSEARDELLTRLARRRTPRARLVALIDELDGSRNLISDYGCPIGTLSSELNKRNGTQEAAASHELLGSMVDWAEAQFREMGQREPRELAISLIAAYEGATVLTHSLRDPDLMHRQSRRLRRWVESLGTSSN